MSKLDWDKLKSRELGLAPYEPRPKVAETPSSVKENEQLLNSWILRGGKLGKLAKRKLKKLKG